MTEPFVPVRPNPYIVGNPVRGSAMFFGREAEFRLVRERFQHAERGGLFVFCGERRSGKTSILFQILDRRLGPEFIPVLIDMQSMAVGSEAEFLGRLCEEILAALGGDHVAPPDFASASNRAAAFQRFVEDCLRAHPGKKLILLFDEYELFENKIDDGLLAEDVLYILAGLMERASVFMVFTGSQHLEQRRRAYWAVLGKSIYKRVSYLEPPDAEALVRQPVAGRVRYGRCGRGRHPAAHRGPAVLHPGDLPGVDRSPERAAGRARDGGARGRCRRRHRQQPAPPDDLPVGRARA
jgi:hypothetical protein